MKAAPYHRFEVQSALSQSAALAALSAQVETARLFRVALLPSKANDRRFQGEVSGDSFRISRIMGYRNSFAPNVVGTVRSYGSGSIAEVEMKLHALIIVMLIVIMALLLVGVSIALFAADAQGVFAVLLMPVLAYLGVLWGFWFEAEKQERVLREIFQGR